MQIPYILIGFVVLVLIVSPASASLNKISAVSPVFIGERDLDISSALNGCHTIAWWKNESNINKQAPDKRAELYPINTPPDPIFHFNVSRELFGGYTGTWYCVDQDPYYKAFTVEEPSIDIRVWDLDHNADVTGQSIPLATNITYRIDTNLYQVLLVKNRPNKNPDDSPFTVKLSDPRGFPVSNIYTGSIGKPKTVILPFDSKPYISEPTYYWKEGVDWDHRARNLQGESVYPAGTYTFVLNQNLNHMQESSASLPESERIGKTTKTVLVAFEKEPFVATVTEPPLSPSISPTATAQTTVPTTLPTQEDSPLPTSTPVPRKTTYSPMPEWVVLAGIGIAIVSIARKLR